MPAADVQNKRTLSDSEMLAYSRNRYADRKLDTRMRQISLEAQSARDRHYREITQWHSFCRTSAKTSGWSGVNEHPDEEDRGIRVSPVSRGSPHARTVSATELARSSNFHNEALTRLQKPWAYAYSETSHNSVYNEGAQAARSQAATLFLRHVAYRSWSASDINEGEGKGQPGGRVTSSSHARRTSDGCRSSHSSSKGLPRVRFRGVVSSEKGPESRPRTSMLVTRGQETSLRPSTVHGCAKRSSYKEFFKSSGISGIMLTQQETGADQLPPLSRDADQLPPLSSDASRETSVGNSSLPDFKANSLDSAKTDASKDNDGQERNLTETKAELDIPAHEHLELRASKNNYNIQDLDTQQHVTEDNQSTYHATSFDRPGDASTEDSPQGLENESTQDIITNNVFDAVQYPGILENSLNETPLMILADKIKRQPSSREENVMGNEPDALSAIPESVPAEVSGKTEENLQEVNVDPSAQTSLAMSNLKKPSFVLYTDSKAPSPDGTGQTSDQTGLKSTSKLSSADLKKSGEAESKKDIYDRARKTHHPRHQEQRMNRLADKEKYPAIAVISDENTSTNSSDTDGLTASSSFKLNKDMDTKLTKTENAETSPKQPDHRKSANDSGGQSPETEHHQGFSHEAVAGADDDNSAVFPSTRSGHPTYIGRRDSVDADDCTLFRGHRIINYVRPQDRYKTDPFSTSRRERLLQRLSMETPVAIGGSRNQVKVAVIFPKHARQRLLQRLVEQNHRPVRTADRGAVHPVLRARIEQFYQTLEPFCVSKRALE